MCECSQHAVRIAYIPASGVDQCDQIEDILSVETGEWSGAFILQEGPGSFDGRVEQVGGAFELVFPFMCEDDFCQCSHDMTIAAEPKHVSVIEADCEICGGE